MGAAKAEPYPNEKKKGEPRRRSNDGTTGLTQFVETTTSLDRDWMIGTHTKDADGTVVQGGTERGRWPFNVATMVV